MKFGIYSSIANPPRGENLDRSIDEVLAEAQLAEACGFDSCFFGEHHQDGDGFLPSSLIVATAVAARIGVVPLAGHQIAFELWSFLALALDAVAIAGQAITGHRLGADDIDGARSAARRMLQWGVVGGVVSGLVVALVRVPLAGVFTDDVAVAATAAGLLWWVALLQPANAVVFVLDGVLIGAGDLRFLAWAMTAAAVAFLAAAGVVAIAGAGIDWLWGALGVLMTARLLALGARYRSGGWAVTGPDRRGR